MNDGVRVTRYEVEEAQAAVMNEPPEDARMSREWSVGKAGETWDEAVRMMVDGDPKSALGLQKYLGVMARIRQNKRSTAHWTEAGSEVDVARFLSGEPDCMMEAVRARRPSPVLKIAVERCVPHYISSEEMRANGASVLAVVESLRTAGVAAEIWVTYSISSFSNSGRKKLSEQVLIQEAGKALDLDRLAFWVASPASFRRIGFALLEQEAPGVRRTFNIRTTGSYGSSETAPPNTEEFDEVAPSWAADVEAWVRDVLNRRAGIEVDTEGDEYGYSRY